MSRNDEAKIQASIVKYIRAVAPHIHVWHTPNGEKREPKIAAKLKWMGTLAGVFDLTLIWEPKRVAFIEVKDEGKSLSDSQKDFAAFLDNCGIPWSICRSIDDARKALEEFGIETREAIAA